MTDRANSAGYDGVAIALHWAVALLILGQIVLGWWMIEIPKEPVGVRAFWFNLHKSLGMTLAILIAIRVAWRLTHRPPPLPASVPAWQAKAAAINHFLLYACLVVMPVAGFLGSTFSGFPIKFFGLQFTGWGWKNLALKDFFSLVHLFAAWLLSGLIVLHVAAALKHLLITRDGVFLRMWPRGSRGGAAAATARTAS
jgi:cytochrome b561